jgi:hypothetical protein
MSTVWENINISVYECHEGHECFSYIFPFVLWISTTQFGWSVQGQKEQSQPCCDVCETSERPFTSKRIRTKLSKSEFYIANDLMMCFYWCYGKWRLLKTSFGRICKTIRDTRKRIGQLSIRIQLTEGLFVKYANAVELKVPGRHSSAFVRQHKAHLTDIL